MLVWTCMPPPTGQHRGLFGRVEVEATTSMSFSANRGPLLPLKVSIQRGCRPRLDQIRCTVAGLTPTFLAIVRHDQRVCPAGVLFVVSSTLSAIFSSGIKALRPQLGFTFP